MSIRVERVSKSFGRYPALHDVSLQMRDREFLALLGPSGSGKTTLLRIIAGLEFPDSGEIWFDGREVTGLPVRDRHVGFVFQHYALFRHMRVRDNVSFGLTVRKRTNRLTSAQRRDRAQELLDLVQLGDVGDRYPAQLSGGQRQRVALARALAVNPKLLLLDEPFGALDAKVRKDLRRWLRQLHDQMGIPTVFVTHDQEEALELADRVVVMHDGSIEQIASPQEVYENPATPFVFGFVGQSNALPVSVTGRRILFQGQDLQVGLRPDFAGSASLFFRPEDAEITSPGRGTLPIIVEQVSQLGGLTRVEGKADGLEKPVELHFLRRQQLKPGERIAIKINRARLFPSDTIQEVTSGSEESRRAVVEAAA